MEEVAVSRLQSHLHHHWHGRDHWVMEEVAVSCPESHLHHHLQGLADWVMEEGSGCVLLLHA